MSENLCIVCGEVIPEGRQICLSCERRGLSPCKDCKDRQIGCHVKCERYGAFRSSHDDVLAQRAMEMEYKGYKFERKYATWKKFKNKKSYKGKGTQSHEE